MTVAPRKSAHRTGPYEPIGGEPHMRLLCRILSAALCAGLGALAPTLALAQAGPPLLTDDPGTPGDGHWEINLAWTTERSDDLRVNELPLADINFGVGERVQLKFELPWNAIDGRGTTANGFGNALAGVKWRFFDAGEHGWQLSTYPQAEFLMPGLHGSSLAEPGVGYLLPIEIQRDFGSIEAGAEVGRWMRPGVDTDSWIAGVAIGREVGEGVEVLGELHDECRVGDGAHELVLNVGARRRLSEHFTLLASLGSDLHNGIDRRNVLISYLALQLTL